MHQLIFTVFNLIFATLRASDIAINAVVCLTTALSAANAYAHVGCSENGGSSKMRLGEFLPGYKPWNAPV